MAKTHASLSPRTNVLLIIVWACVVVTFLLLVEPRIPPALAVIGGVLGLAGGLMQHLSLTQAKANFAGAASLMDVRRALTKTKWGRRYIFWLYFCKAALIVCAIFLIGHSMLQVVFGYLAAYASLMCVREIVTLRDVFALQRFVIEASANEHPAA